MVTSCPKRPTWSQPVTLRFQNPDSRTNGNSKVATSIFYIQYMGSYLLLELASCVAQGTAVHVSDVEVAACSWLNTQFFKRNKAPLAATASVRVYWKLWFVPFSLLTFLGCVNWTELSRSCLSMSVVLRSGFLLHSGFCFIVGFSSCLSFRRSLIHFWAAWVNVRKSPQIKLICFNTHWVFSSHRMNEVTELLLNSLLDFWSQFYINTEAGHCFFACL